MTDSLTARQTQILKAIVDEYLQTADPVGSTSLEKKYNLGVSPATVRNEMVNLTKMNYLKQPHTSAGRVPTPLAMKFYIGQLMEEKQMSLADEVKAKEEMWDSRDNLDKFMDEVTHSLAQRVHNPTVVVMENGGVWRAGFTNVFDNPEFCDNTQACVGIFSLLEEAQMLHELMFQRLLGASPIEVIFGDDLGWPGLRPVSVVATRFRVKGKNGALGVIGPIRQRFPEVVPALRYFGKMIQEIVGR